MFLMHEQIIPLVHNALKIEEDEQQRLRFRRFTEEQIADYASDGETFPVRCRASANITLDLITDADWIGFEYDVAPGSSQSFYSFDLFVDGTLWDTRLTEDLKSSGTIFELPHGSHRITLFLPWSAEIILKNLAVTDGSNVTPVSKRSCQIMTIGDSITQGYIAHHPGCTWVGKLTRELDAEVLNLGIGGYGFYMNSLKHPHEWDPALIILAYGTNDYALESTKADYFCRAAEYIDRLVSVYMNVPILLSLPIYRHDEKHVYREKSRSYTLKDACGVLRGIAKRYQQISVMDDSHYPHTPDFYAPDYLHPNDAGFLVHGTHVVNTVKQVYPYIVR